MRGWAADFDSEEPSVQVEIYSDERLVHVCSPDHDRPDVAKLFGSSTLRSGWNCQFPGGDIDLEAWITVKVVGCPDHRHAISLAKLRDMLSW